MVSLDADEMLAVARASTGLDDLGEADWPGWEPTYRALLESIDNESRLHLVGRVMTRGQLIDRIWGADYVGDTKTLDVHVKRLRTKIEADPANPRYLVTVRGLGYKFEG